MVLRNRIKAAKLALLVCPLMFLLAFSEIAELTSLRDDTSNDYSCQIFSDSVSVKSVVSNVRLAVAQLPTLRKVEFRDEALFHLLPASDPPQAAPHDLLHLLCLLRT